jgi:hypothetical protein
MLDDLTRTMIEHYRRAGVTGAPCDEFDVQDLEQQLAIRFPVAYKAFLLVAGNGFTPFEGSHYALEDDFAELQRAGKQILQTYGKQAPAGAFVFFVHQGFVVRLFLLNDGEDPPVFECVDGSPIEQLSPRFSEFLMQEARSGLDE